jgi:hypothetical protein
MAVTLYLNRSELEHQGSLTLPAGTSRVAVRGVAGDFEDESIEVRLGAGAELLSVGANEADEDDTPRPAPTPTPANRAAADSLSRTADELIQLEAELKGLEEEKALLLANRVLPAGTQANWSTELQKGATLLRTRLVAIQLENNRLLARQTRLKALTTALERRAKVAAADADQPLLLLVRAARAGSFPITLRYALTHRSAWRPMLEIRANETGREVQFVSSGQVRNRTGIPWQRVKLTLINQYMEMDVTKPEMEPWTLDTDGDDDHGGEGRIDAFVVKGSSAGRPVDVAQSTRYEVPEPITLAASGNRIITMPALTLAGRPEYLALPKMSEKVFLQTKVSGWEGLQLPERAKVYYRGAYVGNTDLEDRAYNDSLETSLGYDDRIIIGRTKLEDFSRNVGGQKRRVRLTYELNVRNLHPEAVRIKIQDQVPVSSEKEIEVKVVEASGAQVEERIGRLTWYLNLASNTSQRLRFSFEVEFPRDKEVNIINHRVRIKSPKFR